MSMKGLKMMFFYAHRSLYHLNLIREAFYCCRWQLTQRPQKCTMCTVWEALRHSGVSETFSTNSSPSRLRDLCELGGGKTVWAGANGLQGKSGFWIHQYWFVHEYTETVAECTRLAQVEVKQGSVTEKGEQTQGFLHDKKLSAINTFCQWGNHFSSIECP